MANPRRKSGVTGDREVVAALRELAKVDIKLIDESAVEALVPMRDKTVENLKSRRNYAGKYPGFPNPKSPRKGGHLDQGIKIRKEGGNTKGRSFTIAATKRARYTIHLLEFGTAPHFQPNFKGGFMHPGSRAFPTMTPAFEEHKDDVPARFGQSLWLSLSAKAARLNKKTPRRR